MSVSNNANKFNFKEHLEKMITKTLDLVDKAQSKRATTTITIPYIITYMHVACTFVWYCNACIIISALYIENVRFEFASLNNLLFQGVAFDCHVHYYLYTTGFCRLLSFFLNQLLSKMFSGITSECQTVWIQSRPHVGPALCPNCLQKILAGES